MLVYIDRETGLEYAVVGSYGPSGPDWALMLVVILVATLVLVMTGA